MLGKTVLLLLSALCAAASAGEPYHVVHGWPQLPDDMVLGQISGVAVDRQDRVCVFNRAENSWSQDPDNPLKLYLANNPAPPVIPSAAILCFDGASGRMLQSFGADRFYQPHGLRFDPQGHIWVTDLVLQQVMEFTYDGKLLKTLGTLRVKGQDATHFDQPADIAFAADGSLYVADGYGNNRIAKFAADGRFLLEWGSKGSGPGEFDLPHSVAVDKSGRVYVADRNNARIQVFDADGRFLDQWKSPELGRPWGLAIGQDNLLYVVDGGDTTPPYPPPKGRGRVIKLDLEGHILARWSRFGNYDGQIYWGHDLAVGADGAVYVGDVFHGMRVQKFIPDRDGSAAQQAPGIQISDVELFYRIYYSADGHPSADHLQHDYLDAGSDGLHQLAKMRKVTGVAIGGPVNGVQVGLEAPCAADSLDPDPEERFVHVIAHEYAHVQQAQALDDDEHPSVLEASLVEGIAEFMAELTSGSISNSHLAAWAKGREYEIESQFPADQDKTDLSRWLYNGKGTAEWPGIPF
jgi:peptidylamidoglycolate lyase